MLYLVTLALLGALPALAQAPGATVRPEPPKTAATAAAATTATGTVTTKKHAQKARHRKLHAEAVIPIPPTQAIPHFTPEQLPPEPPQVSFQDGVLAVNSRNSTFGDLMGAVRRLTGVSFESMSGTPVENFPNKSERVAAVLSGPPREVIGSLLDGANLGYILVSAPGRPEVVKTVVLTSSPQTQRATQASAAGAGVLVPPVNASAMSKRPEPPPDEEEPPPMNAPPIEQTQLPPPGAPVPVQPGMMPGQMQGPPQMQQPGSNAEQPQSQPRTPAELLQMLQQRNQNRQTGDSSAPTPPQP